MSSKPKPDQTANRVVRQYTACFPRYQRRKEAYLPFTRIMVLMLMQCRTRMDMLAHRMVAEALRDIQVQAGLAATPPPLTNSSLLIHPTLPKVVGFLLCLTMALRSRTRALRGG